MENNLQKKIIIFSSIAFGITWLIAFGIYGLFKTEQISEYQLNLFHSFAAIGPTVAAFITVHLFYGKQGTNALLSKVKFSILDRKTLLFILSPLLFLVIGIFVFRIVKGEWYSFSHFMEQKWLTAGSFIVWLLPLLTYAILEEIGWRGFLLPHLQEKFTAWQSTIYLTIIWAAWHFPFFFYRFHFSLSISIGFFFGIFVGSIILTSIYNSSKGTLVPVMLFHFLNNFCSEFDKEIIAAVLSTGFVFIAVFIYKTLGKEHLSVVHRTQNYLINKFK